jgi:hypothetical protein
MTMYVRYPYPPRSFELFSEQAFELPGGRGKDVRIARLHGPKARAWAQAKPWPGPAALGPGPGSGPRPMEAGNPSIPTTNPPAVQKLFK